MECILTITSLKASASEDTKFKKQISHVLDARSKTDFSEKLKYQI